MEKLPDGKHQTRSCPNKLRLQRPLHRRSSSPSITAKSTSNEVCDIHCIPQTHDYGGQARTHFGGGMFRSASLLVGHGQTKHKGPEMRDHCEECKPVNQHLESNIKRHTSKAQPRSPGL